MRAPTFPIDVDDSSPLPLYVRIGRALTADIRRGRLKPGDPIPGSRELATSLGVHRNTVLAAIRELVSEGILVTVPARGTFVADEAVARAPRLGVPQPRLPGRPSHAFRLREDWPTFPPDPPASALVLAGGIPDVGLVPRKELARAYRHVLLKHGRTTLSYGPAQGEPALRSAIARWLAETRSLPCSPDEILLTRGSQMALFLAARALVEPGDHVAVEAFGYRPAWDALRLAGARLVPVPVDQGGLDLDVLQRAAESTPGGLRAVYVTPHHQYPTTVPLAPSRRARLLALAHEHRFAILEDDYDHEFHYDGRPLAPLASVDRKGNVLYFGTLSKVVAPGLRAGFLVGATEAIERLVDLRRLIDRQGDATQERALAELLEEGTVARHVRRARRIYHRRRDEFVAELLSRFEDLLHFQVPRGGTAIFAHVDRRIDVTAWVSRAAAQGLTLFEGARFAFDGHEPNALRLGFAQLDEETRARALGVLAASMPVPRDRDRSRARGRPSRQA
jgi:GntR family transcriptional regulator / MocR family aminotransferase